MERQKCKGTRDLLPQDMAKFRLLEEVFRSSCSRWGYREVRTPTLEYLHLFTSAGTLTPGALGKMYSFLDWDGWSGERVVLRPDGTIPVARLYVDEFEPHEMTRFFYIENIFSFEEGEKSRERWQCGAELLGSSEPMADVELILLASEVLSQLGYESVRVRLSHAGLLKALLRGLGLGPGDEVWDQILGGNTKLLLDKVEGKVPQLREVLTPLFEAKAKSPSFLKSLKASLTPTLPGLEKSFDNFANIAQLLDAMECKYEFDVALGRDFEYYTGIAFQFYLGEHRVGGGGRYDDLIPLVGGKNIPASGFAIYLDELMALIEPKDVEKDFKSRILVGSEVDAPQNWKLCFDAAGVLRRNGYITELGLGRGKFDGRWLLLARSGKAPPFLLIDQAANEKRELDSLVGALKILEEARCH